MVLGFVRVFAVGVEGQNDAEDLAGAMGVGRHTFVVGLHVGSCELHQLTGERVPTRRIDQAFDLVEKRAQRATFVAQCRVALAGTEPRSGNLRGVVLSCRGDAFIVREGRPAVSRLLVGPCDEVAEVCHLVRILFVSDRCFEGPNTAADIPDGECVEFLCCDRQGEECDQGETNQTHDVRVLEDRSAERSHSANGLRPDRS